MTTVFISVGDITVTLITSQSLDHDDPIRMHYTLHFRDVPTDAQQTISCTTELEAMNLVAAWIVSDEKSIGVLEQYRDKLYKSLKSTHFLP